MADPGTPRWVQAETDRVRRVESDYDEAWGRGDVDGLLRCLTDDVVLVSPRGDVARGSAEARALLVELFAGWARGSSHRSTVLRVDLLTEDVAVLDGTARLSGLGPQAPGVDPDGSMVHGYTDVLVRRDGRWRIAHVRARTGGEELDEPGR
ncbi:SgcJ/EcaC family oxidoreductase [uncultured Phycicoccus sp.]|uniref:YybH family protein n=1 Tax=uncultured Phycicoccus sp. TaxID=661422 RepID=UPI00262C9A50|nr:SgcJ/EcaC family oxidoreductase [uncultured Phycicoccus sp.]